MPSWYVRLITLRTHNPQTYCVSAAGWCASVRNFHVRIASGTYTNFERQGIPEGEVQPIKSVYPGIMIAKALQVVGSAVGTRKEAIETMEFAARGIVKTHYRTEKMDKLTAIFEEMNEGKVQGRVVLDLSS
jgi:D-arabinose 1-dehydrogenase-like Zn-dependent alcohol dehydrogenase